jgi:hypothetical protein
LCGGRVAKSRLVPPPLMLDSIREKTLVADYAHTDQRTVDAGGQEFLAQAGQRRRVGSAEHVGRNREIEMID